MRDKELHELRLVFLGDALEIEDLAEVGVGSVGDVDEVGLNEGFGGRGMHLEGFEERVEAGHDKGDTLDVAGWWGCGWGGGGEKVFEGFGEGVGV